MTPHVDPTRLAQIVRLDAGAHDDFSAGACAMEAVAYVAGEPWSDHPRCACPVIAAFMRSWNDALPDEDRTRLLLPLVPRLVGTRGSDALADRRATMAVDWFIRVHTPAWLRLAGLTAHADLISGMPEIVDFARVPSLLPALEAARTDAADARADARAAVGSAAWAAAGDAADVAWDAAWGAAWADAWDAADAAWDAADAAWAAAWAAAWDAAWAAAGSAVGDALASTVRELQASAVVLVERMCSLTEETGA